MIFKEIQKVQPSPVGIILIYRLCQTIIKLLVLEEQKKLSHKSWFLKYQDNVREG